MQYRQFGNTDLEVSTVGFGAWAIGGPAMAGDIAIGWGNVDDRTSIAALKAALDAGINFYDTADFYGLGHSEKLIGQVWGNRDDVIIATKVGHRLDPEDRIYTDYSKSYIIEACEASLKRLKRERIDFYQLHTAKVAHLESGECVEALQDLQQAGKIRYWGVSLNTFAPEPEGNFLLQHQLGQGMQVVLNVINQHALPLIQEAGKQGYGIIARMPLQFGLLTGKFEKDTHFDLNDHRSFRLTPEILQTALDALEPVFKMAETKEWTPSTLALGFILGFPEVSTVIPGIKTGLQARQNAAAEPLNAEMRTAIEALYQGHFEPILRQMQQVG